MGEQRKLKGRHVDMLDEIAKKLGVDPSEAFGHIVGRAHEQMFGAAEGQNGAQNPEAEPAAKGDSSVQGEGEKPKAPPTPAPSTANAAVGTSIPGRGRVAKVVVVQPPDGPPLGESIAAQKARESGLTEPQNDASASDESDDAPPEKMGGSRPNPLSLKRWASMKTDEDEDEDRQRSVAKQRQILASGRAQR